jgi:hypothetical protein
MQGYLAARTSSDNSGADRGNAAALISSVADYCHGHAKEDLASAIASTLKK